VFARLELELELSAEAKDIVSDFFLAPVDEPFGGVKRDFTTERVLDNVALTPVLLRVFTAGESAIKSTRGTDLSVVTECAILAAVAEGSFIPQNKIWNHLEHLLTFSLT
jgi:hypothetical protein